MRNPRKGGGLGIRRGGRKPPLLEFRFQPEPIDNRPHPSQAAPWPFFRGKLWDVNLFIAIALLMPFALAAQRSEYGKTHPPRESVRLIPLTDIHNGRSIGDQDVLYRDTDINPHPASHKARRHT